MRILFFIIVLNLPLLANANDWAFSTQFSSLGFSLGVGKPITSNVNGRLTANTFNYDDTITESGIDYDVGLDLSSVGLLLDWHPSRSAFRVTFGGYYNGNEADLEAKSLSGTFNINGTIYNVSDIGSLRGDVTYGSSAPYLGVGWGNIKGNESGWGMAWDLGVLYQGSPDVGLDVTCSTSLTAGQCTTLTSDVAAESQALRSDIEDQKWYPVFSLGVLYRF